MRKTATILIAIFVVQMLAYAPGFAASSLRFIEAESALLIEQNTGTILYEQNISKRHPADAFAKVVMLLLAAQAVEDDEISDNEVIEMTESAWFDLDEDSPTQSIQPGQRMTFIDLIYSAYVGNASEACNMIALRLAGSVDAFVRRMNTKATELGCSDTWFVNPHGRYDENQYTTAYDIYTIYSEALKSKLFCEVAGTFRHTTESTEDTESRTLVSANSMLNQNSIYYYRYCLTGLCGNSYEGGYSMVASAEEDGLALISVVLGARDVINDDESVTLQHFTETYRLFMWGYANYGWREILKTSDLLARVPVEHGAGADSVNVRPERALTLLLENAVSADAFTMNIIIYSEEDGIPLIAPIAEGDKLGEVIVSKGNVVYDTIPLLANTEIEENPWTLFLRNLGDFFVTPLARNIIIVIIVVVVIYAALVIRYNVMRINRLRRIKEAKNDIVRERYENFRD